ncbi:hypothetical protein GCM10025857_03990 [Alicyclobacillus contaminans]|uniref:flagellar hook-basal body complex protein FliE n=1 Tax=Alicyclobacillus contaminans TaxID=392016 RepID=UPI00041B88F7|nr:flagellar hook-basal body complex protein FliE [Alicyclobacillus contaminans]GMA49042.1 hypothetical protein GCM10025857_03990 [Alicyclobacillus contaminans]
MVTIAGVSNTGLATPASTSTSAAGSAAGSGFADALQNALDQVNATTNEADQLASSFAAGGPVSIDQLMVAEQEASLAVDMVVQVRNRVVSAYQSIMNMQI